MEDENILKVTVNPVSVAMELTDYGVFVASVFDLRYLATKCGSQAWTLPRLSVEQLKVRLTEDYRLDQVRWTRKNFAKSDVNYAAKEVRVPIELFKIFEEKLKDPSTDDDVRKFIDKYCKEYLNKSYRKEIAAKKETAAEVQTEIILPKPRISLITTAEECKTAVEQLLSYVSSL